MSRETIAKALRKLREESGMTADEVGALVGKSGKTVNAWENNRGQPDADMLMTLCKIYNVENILSVFAGGVSLDCSTLSAHEMQVISRYRANPAMQPAVDKLLGLVDEEIINKKDA